MSKAQKKTWSDALEECDLAPLRFLRKRDLPSLRHLRTGDLTSLRSMRKSVMPKVKYKPKEPTAATWPSGALRTLASFMMDAHSFIIQLLFPPLCNFSSHKSLSSSFSHLCLGLPTFLLLSGLLSKILLVTLVCSILVTCPATPNLTF